MFNLTIGSYIGHLTNLKNILEKAKAWQQDHKISDETVMTARLTLDQFTLAQQVRSVTNFAKGTVNALCDIPAPVFSDDEKTLTDLQTRIDAVVTFLKTVTPDMVKNDLETRIIPLVWMPGKGLTAKYYAEVYGHDNFYFHYTTAYSILRHYGLQIGKMDFMGGIDFKDLS